jgi:translation initiation factor 1
MSRKPRVPTDGAPALSSNPFAALGGALGDLPPGAPPSTPPDEVAEPADAPAPALRGKIVVRREKKGRGGKAVTVIDGLRLPPEALADMAQQLRRSLGCGAHVEGETLVLTGAQTDRVHDWLSAKGATRIVIGN